MNIKNVVGDNKLENCIMSCVAARARQPCAFWFVSVSAGPDPDTRECPVPPRFL